MIVRNPEVANQPLFFGKIEDVAYEKSTFVILPGMVNIGPALQDEKLISFLRELGEQDVLIAAISSAPPFICQSRLVEGHEIYRWNLAKLL